MRIGNRQKCKQVYAILHIILCGGLLLTETHGIIGHTLCTLSETARPQGSAAFDLRLSKLIASKQDNDEPSCSICYCYKLIDQIIVPQTYCLIHSTIAVQTHNIRPIFTIHINANIIGNRSPPQALSTVDPA
jgi:hypothetical protein